ncbi:MAG: Hsp20/alpha crystallin family protein [Fidelibacterota bacterium]
MNLIKWTPRKSLVTDFDRMLDEFFENSWFPTFNLASWSPAVDIEEREKEYVLTADVPGLNKKDVKVTVRDGILTISGDRKDEKKEEKGNYYYRERRIGSFCRSFRLPEGVNEDEIQAKFKNGILTVNLPKSETALPMEKEIKIS